ncbi:hypothetical protein NON00_08455 [Roseomonas sp. GC11]|uniref:hypothetical protein n=1 Tax=Roseomonas sp. GC11 TaxID=2950546 RepID=UPI00210883CC|nr:hypothetical protein [Roseomonas sp. GC11]MCQ4159960.1 hypothetical protein [Roseomonas sp. GC11]
MQINRRGPGEACLVVEGRDVLDLLIAEASDEEYERVLGKLERLLVSGRGAPRVALSYQGGLLGPVQADVPVEVIVIEEDPHDDPPLRLLRREVGADPAGVEATVAVAERRAGLPPGRQAAPGTALGLPRAPAPGVQAPGAQAPGKKP